MIPDAGGVQPSSPVFIVGSARSGTSVLVDGLLGSGYNGHREGHFLNLLHSFERVAGRQRTQFGQPNPLVLAGRIDWDAFVTDVADIFKRHAEALNPVPPWVDKTGGADMIGAIPSLTRLWPACKFIFAKRRALENVSSRIKKFPRHDFETHCAEWARTMAAWRAARDALGERGIEVDQQDILRSPQATAARLANFLGMSPAAGQRMLHKFQRNRPQATDDGSTARVFDLATVGWSAARQEIFLRLCGPEMAQFNYGTDELYWDNQGGRGEG